MGRSAVIPPLKLEVMLLFRCKPDIVIDPVPAGRVYGVEVVVDEVVFFGEGGGLGAEGVEMGSSNLGPPGEGGEAFFSLFKEAKLYLGLYDPEAMMGSSER